jgi:hypothetical protein
MRSLRVFVPFCLFAALALIPTATSQVPLEYAPSSTTSILPPNPHASEPGLLFYLSGDHGLTADYAAGGNPVPNYVHDVKILPSGAHGSYIQCGDNQLLSYWAPGNIYSQRGTLSFFWRSREPVDETAFPVFRVGFADHSSWDMVWLRMDWNGHGFDAFVTDVNLGRTRVSVKLPEDPKPDEWIHLALAWDETSGIRFYVNGKLAATKEATGLFDSALDQFGPHSRVIGPTGVESSYSYDRGGDIDELRIYDRELSDDNIAGLAQNQIPQNIPAMDRTVELLSSALSRSDSPLGLTVLDGRTQDMVAADVLPQLVKDPAAYCIEYKDGTRATLLMLTGANNDFVFSARLAGQETVSTQFFRSPTPNVTYTACLAAKVEHLFTKRSSPYPVRRTLLTSGILEAGLLSRHCLNERVETPHLSVKYEAPNESQYART